MKILFAPAEFTFSKNAGSKPSWCYYYIKTLLEKGVKVTLICDNEDQSCKITHENLTVIAKQNIYNPKPNIIQAGLFHLWLTVKIPSIIKKYGPFDAVHHFGNFGNRTSFNLPLLLGLFEETPFVFGPLEEEVKTIDKNWGWISSKEKIIMEIVYKILFRNLVRLTLQKSANVVCQGPVALDFYKQISEANYTIINPGILDLNKKVTNKSTSENKTIITIGSTNKLKRIAFIINIIEKVKKDIPDIALKIIGSGPEDETIQKLVKSKGLEQSVKLMGQKLPLEVKAELTGSAMYINASLYESFGQAMLEAMASGLPIVASETPGSKILIEDSVNGYIIKHDLKEKDNFTRCIIEMLKNKTKLTQMSKNAIGRTEKLFLWDKLANKYIKIYKRIKDAS